MTTDEAIKHATHAIWLAARGDGRTAAEYHAALESALRDFADAIAPDNPSAEARAARFAGGKSRSQQPGVNGPPPVGREPVVPPPPPPSRPAPPNVRVLEGGW